MNLYIKIDPACKQSIIWRYDNADTKKYIFHATKRAVVEKVRIERS